MPPVESTVGFPPLKGLGNCTRLQTPANCDPSPCWACNITLHFSSDLATGGAWTPHTTQLIGLSNYDNIMNWNPAPVVLPNGSIAVMIHTDDNNGWSGESIAIADTWQGPYTVTVGNEAVANEPLSQEGVCVCVCVCVPVCVWWCKLCYCFAVPPGCFGLGAFSHFLIQQTRLPHKFTDPFMWIDARGNYHALVHKMFDPQGMGPCGWWAGGHLFSTDGTKWSPIYRAYNTTVRTQDGGEIIFQRRERPKLIFDANKVPTHLFNGAITNTTATDSGVYTIVAPLNV